VKAPATTADTLAEEVVAREWYHTLDLAPGIVTPGWFDTRQVVERVPFPPSLSGLRCLDVGTFDGFWAFEMERRAAEEVVAIDVIDPRGWDWPLGSDSATLEALARRMGAGEGFELARRALRSSVERMERSVYDLDPAVDGEFDLVYVGSLLMHLRDPVRALERVRGVCKRMLIVVDNIDLALSLLHPRRPVATLDGIGRPWWWRANVAGLRRMVEAGGFALNATPRRIFMPPGKGQPLARTRPRLLASRAGREALLVAWKGDPHAILSAVPRPLE
jgi:tRNA (mo5U34)-methyltransferase